MKDVRSNQFKHLSRSDGKADEAHAATGARDNLSFVTTGLTKMKHVAIRYCVV